MNNQVLFVGAGPVGLWTACQLKIRNPEVAITILDKHENYQRKHLLRVAHSSLSSSAEDPRLQRVIDAFKQYHPSGRFWKTSAIPVNVLENRLSTLAENLGITIQRNFAVTPDMDLKATFPNASIIVGADGAHSTVREIIDEGNPKSLLKFNYIVQMRYFVEGKAKKLPIIRGRYPAEKMIGSLARENIGKMDQDGKTPITIRMFVTKDEYLQVEDARFKNPYSLDQLPQSLQNKMQTWLDLRKKHFDEKRVLGSEKITATPLGTYLSRIIVKKEGDIIYCLVGDAAFGVPFFRSLNNGLISGTKLAKKISTSLEKPAKQDTYLRSYARSTRWLARIEIIKALIKNFFISIGNWIVYINGLMPWQFVTFQRRELPA